MEHTLKAKLNVKLIAKVGCFLFTSLILLLGLSANAVDIATAKDTFTATTNYIRSPIGEKNGESIASWIKPEFSLNEYSGSIEGCKGSRGCAELVYSVESGITLKNSKIKLILPKGISDKHGSLTWGGTLEKNNPTTMGVVVGALEDGNYDVTAILINSEIDLSIRTVLPVKVKNGVISIDNLDDQENDIVDNEEPLALEVGFTEVPNSIRVKDASSVDITTTISGRCFYYNKEYEINKPIKNAVIELWDEDSDTDDLISTSSTDSEGAFNFTIQNIDEDENGRLDIYIKIKAESSLGAGYVVKSTNGIFFKNTKTVDNIKYGSYTYEDIIVPESVVGASFHILDVITDAYNFVNALGVEQPPNKIRIKFSSKVPHTAYVGPEIRVKKGVREVQWQSSLILHEYGHYVMDTYSGIDHDFFSYCHDKGEVSPNCYHGFFTQEDEGAAWVEGWAHMFSTAVRCESGYEHCQVYVMPVISGNSVSYLNIDMETLTNLLISANQDGVLNKPDTVEASVAAILYDIYDSNDELSIIPNAGDSLSLGFDEIWDITVNYDPPGSSSFPRTIYDFWDGWLSTYGQRNELNDIYWANQVDKNEGPKIELLNQKDLVFTSGNIDISLSVTDVDGHVSYVYAELRGKIKGEDGEWKTIPVKTAYSIDPNYEETFKNIGYDYVVRPSNSGDLWEFSVSIPPMEYSSPEIGVNIYAMDNLANSTKFDLGDGEYSLVVYLDTEPPNVEITAPSEVDYGEVYLRLNYSDDLSGVDSCRCRNNDEPWLDWEPCFEGKSWELSKYGENTVYYQIRDKVGNIKEASTVVIFSPTNLVCSIQVLGENGINENPECEYTSIKEAIDNAEEFDTILVEPGVYNEENGISINKKISLKGLKINGETPVIYSRNNPAVTIYEDDAVLEGFEIKGSPGIGIFVKSSRNTIDSCKIYENGYGVILLRGKGNTIKDSEIEDNKYIGVYSYFSGKNRFVSDSIHGNGYYGMLMYGSDNNVFSDCKIGSNGYYGLLMYYSDNNMYNMGYVSQGVNCGALQYRCTGNTFYGMNGGVCTV